jgi:hypothetical protein
VPTSALATLILAAVVVLSAFYIHRRGFLRSKGVTFAVGLILLLFIGYLLMGGFGPT